MVGAGVGDGPRPAHLLVTCITERTLAKLVVLVQCVPVNVAWKGVG